MNYMVHCVLPVGLMGPKHWKQMWHSSYSRAKMFSWLSDGTIHWLPGSKVLKSLLHLLHSLRASKGSFQLSVSATLSWVECENETSSLLEYYLLLFPEEINHMVWDTIKFSKGNATAFQSCSRQSRGAFHCFVVMH